MVEAAFDRRIERTMRIAAVDPPDRPLCALGIVSAQGRAIGDAARLVERVLFDILRSVDEKAIAASAIEFPPFAACALEPMMDAPFAGEEIEIMRAAGGRC